MQPGMPIRGSSLIPQYSVRDNSRRRVIGLFGSENEALAFLIGRTDGYYSVNDGHGGWCEVEIWKGERFIRRELMTHGSPTPFVRIDAAE